MEKDFVPYEEALVLKELGFDEPCNTCYDKLEMVASYGASVFDYKNYNTTGYMVSRPTFSQAFRWFREKYNLRGFIGFRPNVKQFDHHIYDMSLSGIEYTKQRTMAEYNKDPLVGTYEEAELACLKKLIEIANEKHTDSTGIS
jgi:hypothetical protein